jgi:hypothetical protein
LFITLYIASCCYKITSFEGDGAGAVADALGQAACSFGWWLMAGANLF